MSKEERSKLNAGAVEEVSGGSGNNSQEELLRKQLEERLAYIANITKEEQRIEEEMEDRGVLLRQQAESFSIYAGPDAYSGSKKKRIKRCGTG